MTFPRSFEEVMAERTRTLDDIRAIIERMNQLIDLIAEQIKLEQHWMKSSSDAEASPDD